MGVRQRTLHGVAGFFEIRRFHRQPTPRRLGIGDGGGERLVDLVSDRCRKRSQRCQRCNARNFHLRGLQLFLGVLALGDLAFNFVGGRQLLGSFDDALLESLFSLLISRLDS